MDDESRRTVAYVVAAIVVGGGLLLGLLAFSPLVEDPFRTCEEKRSISLRFTTESEAASGLVTAPTFLLDGRVDADLLKEWRAQQVALHYSHERLEWDGEISVGSNLRSTIDMTEFRAENSGSRIVNHCPRFSEGVSLFPTRFASPAELDPQSDNASTNHTIEVITIDASNLEAEEPFDFEYTYSVVRKNRGCDLCGFASEVRAGGMVQPGTISLIEVEYFEIEPQEWSE